MNSPGITRGRRAFLTPIWFAAFSVLLAAAVLFAAVRWSIDLAGQTTTLVVLRHAETSLESAADASQAEPPLDPPLSEAGHRRAERLAQWLSASEPAAIWVSDTARSRQTAQVLAERLGLTPEVYQPNDLQGTLNRIGREHAGQLLVVVGHSNTLPALVQRLTRGQYRMHWSETEYDRLVVVTVTRFGPPSVLELRY